MSATLPDVGTRILFFADAASVHTRRWVAAVVERGAEAIVITRQPAEVPGATEVIAIAPGSDKLTWFKALPEVRRVATRHIKEMVDLIARQSPQWGQPAAHEQALVTMATMVGALVLSRAVDEPALSDSLREAALKHLMQLTNSTHAADAAPATPPGAPG